jgi:hypothetical protein
MMSFGNSLGTERKENTIFAQHRVLRTNPKGKTTPLLGRCPATDIPHSCDECSVFRPCKTIRGLPSNRWCIKLLLKNTPRVWSASELCRPSDQSKNTPRLWSASELYRPSDQTDRQTDRQTNIYFCHTRANVSLLLQGAEICVFSAEWDIWSGLVWKQCGKER